jgi:hypothetical protein
MYASSIPHRAIPSSGRPDATFGEPLRGCSRTLQLLGAKLEPPNHEQDFGGLQRLQRCRTPFGGSVDGLHRIVYLLAFAFACWVRKLPSQVSSADEVEVAFTGESGHTVEKRMS